MIFAVFFMIISIFILDLDLCLWHTMYIGCIASCFFILIFFISVNCYGSLLTRLRYLEKQFETISNK
jgi:hypothetical protein